MYGIILSNYTMGYTKDIIVSQIVDLNSKPIVLQAQHLNEGDFFPDHLDEKGKTFSEFFSKIDNGEILDIQVWSTDNIILYSDNKEIIGKTFNDDHQLNIALGGDLTYNISELKSGNTPKESSFKNILKIFIPIKSNSDKVIGVIQANLATGLIDSYMEKENILLSQMTFYRTVFAITAITLTYFFFRGKLVKPLKRIYEDTKKIGRGDRPEFRPSGFDELKNLSKEMQIMTDLLEEQQGKIVKTERLSAIGELAARLAHDLRNPLYVIRMVLFLIQNKYGINSEINKDVENINLAMNRMSNQIESVMNFVATRPLKISETSIIRVLKSVIKNIGFPESIKINLPTNDITLNCDSDKLEVVFENLFNNAVQSMKDVGILTIRIMEENGLVKIEIEDSGPGIPDKILPKIFDPLFTTKQEGTGLGLPSCKNIIEQHHGTINVKTTIGKGTTIII